MTIEMFEKPGEGEPDPEMRKLLVARFSNDINCIGDEIKEWADVTFPERTRSGMFLKLYKEIGELVDADPEDEGGELADVFIMLLDYGRRKNIDMAAAIRAKMEINRSRTWKKTPAGNWQHVK